MYTIFANGTVIYQSGNQVLPLISPKCTTEIGKAGSLDFGVPPSHAYYKMFEQLKTPLVVESDGEELFRGRVLSLKKNFNNFREVYGEGNLSYLVDSVQKAEKYDGTAHDLFKQIIKKHNEMIGDATKKFEIGTINVENHPVRLFGKSKDDDKSESEAAEAAATTNFNYKQIALDSIADEWQTTYDYIESVLIDYCGGYLRTRRGKKDGKDVTYIDWLKEYFDTSSQTIEFGKNLLDLTEEINPEEVVSVLIPLGDENLTIKNAASFSEGDIHHVSGSNEIYSASAVARFGRIIKTNVFDSVTEVSTLVENAKRYLKEHSTFRSTIEVTAVDLHFINPGVRSIKLGDKVIVHSPAHGYDRQELLCTKIEYDLENPANTVYTFGNPKQSLTERYRKDKQKKNSGGGSAASAVAEKIDENQTDFYDAWVKVEKEKGHIDLGTLFKRVHGDETNIAGGTLITLDSNPDHSAINMWADHMQIDENKKKLSFIAGIDLNADPKSASVNIYAMQKDTQNAAKFLLQVGFNEKTGKSESYANLTANYTTINSKITTISGLLDAIRVKALTVNTNGLYANSISAGNLYASSRINPGRLFNVSDHQHVISINGVEYVTGKPYSGY